MKSKKKYVKINENDALLLNCYEKSDMMKLNWIEFENLDTNLKCNRVEFDNNITLLVGLSGVGKTLILDAIKKDFITLTGNYDDITRAFMYSYKSTINFSVGNNNYEWSYILRNKKDINALAKKEPAFEFEFESLKNNNEELIYRNGTEIRLFNHSDFPSPKKNESLLYQYSEDNDFSAIIHEIQKIYPFDMDINIRGTLDKKAFEIFKQELKKLTPKTDFNLDDISHLPTIVKLHIIKEYYNDSLFVKLIDYVKELFPEITDISVVADDKNDEYVVAIDVYGYSIVQNDISNGMLKSIYYIIELITIPQNSLILIDEFENGLGVNCIDILVDLLLNERSDLQFIITSHHPKIIGNIDVASWKIIDREQSTIINNTTKGLNVAGGQNNAYFNLLNRWEFEGKI